MAFAEVLFILALCICVFTSSMLFIWTIYHDITRTDMPPGFKQRVKLRIVDIVCDSIFGLDKFLGKVGICQEFVLLRLEVDHIITKLLGTCSLQDSNLLIKDLLFDDVPVRMFWPKTPVVGRRRGMLFLHGGVGLFGSIKTHERICSRIARESNSVVVSVGFRLAPEHLFPAQITDCLTAAIHFLKHAENYGVDSNRIIIGGDSSGGTYSATVAQELVTRVDLPKFRGQILLYPFLQTLDLNLPSYQQYHSSPILKKKRALWLFLKCLGKKVRDIDAIMKNAHVPEAIKVKYSKWVSADLIPAEFKVKNYVPPVPAPFSEELYEMYKPLLTRCSPLLAEDEVIRQLPETFILTCEYDILRDDGILYKKRLEDNGVPVTWHHVKDGFHGTLFLIGLGSIEFESTRECFKHVLHFLEGL